MSQETIGPTSTVLVGPIVSALSALSSTTLTSYPDMQFVTNFTRILFQNNLFTRETHKLRQATFSEQTA